jgi:hypothetical protein
MLMDKIDNNLMDFMIRKKSDIDFIYNLMVKKGVTRSAIEKHMNSYLCCISKDDCELLKQYFKENIDYSDKIQHDTKYQQILDCIDRFIRFKNNLRY